MVRQEDRLDGATYLQLDLALDAHLFTTMFKEHQKDVETVITLYYNGNKTQSSKLYTYISFHVVMVTTSDPGVIALWRECSGGLCDLQTLRVHRPRLVMRLELWMLVQPCSHRDVYKARC